MSNSYSTFASRSRVLVTGGAGFIGSHLVEHLLANHAHVTVVDNFFTGKLEHLQAVQSQIQLIRGDIGELLRLKQIHLNEYEYIFHLAANTYIPPSVENPAFDFEANLYNTFLLLEALRLTPGAPRLINASSAAVYGNPAKLPIQETDPTVPISPYGVSKLAAERYLAVYSQIYGIKATSLRFFSVYGPRQRKQVVYDLLRKLEANPKQIEVLGDGSQVRDFTYVVDVAEALLLIAARAPGCGEVFNVATGISYTIADLVSTLCKVCGSSAEVVYSGQIRPGDAGKWAVDISRLMQLGFRTCTSLEAGLAKTWNWFIQGQAEECRA